MQRRTQSFNATIYNYSSIHYVLHLSIFTLLCVVKNGKTITLLQDMEDAIVKPFT